MKHSLILSLLLWLVSVNIMADQQQDAVVEDLLAVKLKADFSTLNSVILNRGGGYDLNVTKLEVGNFIANFSYESFSVDWRQLSELPFGDGRARPLSELKRYHLKVHLPYRLDKNRLL